MMFALLTAVLLTQAPLGVGQVPTSQMGNFPPSSYPQHLFGDQTKGCVQWSFGGTGWKCLVGEGQPVNSLRYMSAPPMSPGVGDTYYDSTKGCLQTWSGSAWLPSTCPLTSAPAQPSPPNTLLSPANAPPSTSIVGATYFDTSVGCLRTWNGTTYNACPSPAPTAPQVFLSPASSPPSTSIVGASYFDTTLGCVRSWNGSAFIPPTCPITQLPAALALVLPPSAGPPSGSFSVGSTYYDTSAGCLRSWNGSSFNPCPPTSQPTAPNTLLSPASTPPSTSVVGATFYDTAAGCLRTWNGTTFSACSPTTQPTPPNTLLNPANSPPTTSIVGATFYDTTNGCLRTWNGSSYSACSTQPAPPNTLLSPASTAPTTSTLGASYYDTTDKCIKTWDGTGFTSCPSNSSGTSMLQANGPPSLPPGQANSNKGKVYFDTALGCTRSTRDGLAYGDCLTTEKCVSVAVTSVSIPLAGISTTFTTTMTGARVGASCSVGYPNFMPLNASGVCRVSAANTIEYRFQSNSGLLSSAIAVPNGTYQFCSEVIW